MCLTMYLKCYFSIIFLQFSIIFGVPKASKKYCKIGVFRYFTVLSKIGRSGGIRTRGLLVPNQALYQTEPHPEKLSHWMCHPTAKLVAEEGFEPSQTESESVVLPLHNSASRRIFYLFRECLSSVRLLAFGKKSDRILLPRCLHIC